MSELRNALNVGEAMVLDLWDGGMTVQQIVEHTGKTRKFVACILSRYSGAEDAKREADVRIGCIAYAAALAGTGKVYA